MDINYEKLEKDTTNQESGANTALHKFVLEKFSYSKMNGYDKLYTSWLNQYAAYHCYLQNKDKYPFESTNYMPITFEVIETMLPKIVNITMANNQIITLRPKTAGGALYANDIERLLNYQALYEMDFQKKYFLAVKDSLIYGTSFVKLGWDSLTSSPVMSVESVFDIFPDPQANDISECNWIIKRSLRPYSYLKELAKQNKLKNVDKVKTGTTMDTGLSGTSIELKHNFIEKRANTSSNLPNTHDKNDELVEILEYIDKNRFIVIASGAVLKNEPTPFVSNGIPFIPYLKITDYPVAQEFYGRGEAEVIGSLQDMSNDMINASLESVFQTINPIIIYDEAAIEDPLKTFVAKPNALWGYNSRRSRTSRPISVLEPRALGYDMYQIYGMMNTQIQKATGATDIVSGFGSKGDQTATESEILATMSSDRFKGKILWICHDFLSLFAKQLHCLNKIFMDEQKEVRAFEDDVPYSNGAFYQDKVLSQLGNENNKNYLPTRLIDRKNIYYDYDYIPMASMLSANKYNRLKQLIEFSQIVGSFGRPMPTLVKTIGELLEIPNAEQISNEMYNPSVDVIAQTQAQGELAQKQAMLMAGNNAGEESEYV